MYCNERRPIIVNDLYKRIYEEERMPKFGEIEINFSYEKEIRDLCCEAGRRIKPEEMQHMVGSKNEKWVLFYLYAPFKSWVAKYAFVHINNMGDTKGAIIRLICDPKDQEARKLLESYVVKLDKRQKKKFAEDFYNYPSFIHLRLDFLPYPF